MRPQDLNTYTYDILVTDAWPPGDPVRAEREWLAGIALNAEERRWLAMLDEALIHDIVDGYCLLELYDDDPAQPLDHWWWHLDAIGHGRYPLDQLPLELRAPAGEASPERIHRAFVTRAIQASDYDNLCCPGDTWRATRERAEASTDAGDRARLGASDAAVLKLVIVDHRDELWPGLFDDDPPQPPERWWWHLGAIRFGCYPIELLAPELRAAVIDAESIDDQPSY